MDVPTTTLKKRRSILISALFLAIVGVVFGTALTANPSSEPNEVLSEQVEGSELAVEVLETLPIKGRAPKTGYERDEFGSGWASIDGCDLRNIMLKRTLSEMEIDSDGCIVLSGVLQDPYTAKTIQFVRGTSTSDEVQIDHVVALSDAWQKGAQDLDFSDRVVFANDPLNLLAVDGPANQEKGDSDAASWLPPNKSFRCQYVARQIAVKNKYRLWVTKAEQSAMKRVLNGCGEQVLPLSD